MIRIAGLNVKRRWKGGEKSPPFFFFSVGSSKLGAVSGKRAGGSWELGAVAARLLPFTGLLPGARGESLEKRAPWELGGHAARREGND